jgi:adenylate kinase
MIPRTTLEAAAAVAAHAARSAAQPAGVAVPVQEPVPENATRSITEEASIIDTHSFDAEPAQGAAQPLASAGR